MRFPSNRRRRALALAAAAALAALGLWAARPQPAPGPASAMSRPQGADVWLQAGRELSRGTAPGLVFHTGLESLPASLHGTEVSGELEEDAQGRLKITRGLRLVYDYFLSASGEEPPAQLQARVRAYLRHRLSEAAAAQALALFDSYLAYKQELSAELRPTPAFTLAEMRARLGAVHAARARRFSPEVVAAFFGDDEAYDRYQLDRLAALGDATLSPQQKAARIAELRAAQPQALREQMDVAETVDTLQTLTAAWQQGGGSADELRQLRLTLVGPDATDRLEALDRQNTAWNDRVAAYLQQRASILGDASLADSTRHQQVEALRTQAFDAHERIRIETIERLQDPRARDAVTPQGSAPPG